VKNIYYDVWIKLQWSNLITKIVDSIYCIITGKRILQNKKKVTNEGAEEHYQKEKKTEELMNI